jgi:hypothetical protein
MSESGVFGSITTGNAKWFPPRAARRSGSCPCPCPNRRASVLRLHIFGQGQGHDEHHFMFGVVRYATHSR